MISLVTQTKSIVNHLAVGRLFRVLSIGRSGYYRGRSGLTATDLKLRDRTHRLSLVKPTYGYRPMTRVQQRDSGELQACPAPHAQGKLT